MTDYIQVSTTTESEHSAQEIAAALVEQRLARNHRLSPDNDFC